MNFLYIVKFRVFDRDTVEVFLSDNQLTRSEVETLALNKTYGTANEFAITEYEIEVKGERVI